MNYLYIIPIESKSAFKIGYTNDMNERLKNHQSNWRGKLGEIDRGLIQFIQSESIYKIKVIEAHLKYIFVDSIANLDVPGHTEIYSNSCLESLLLELRSCAKKYKLNPLRKYEAKIFEPVIGSYPDKKTRTARAIKKTKKTELKTRAAFTQFANVFLSFSSLIDSVQFKNDRVFVEFDREFTKEELNQMEFYWSKGDNGGGIVERRGNYRGKFHVLFMFSTFKKDCPELWCQLPIELHNPNA
jgi:hypothetical protein